MCGYLTFISTKNKTYPHKEFENAFNLLSHRGPDFSKIIHGKKNDFSYQLGHHRLAIRDLSNNATQPIFSDCGNYILLYNGEIYNLDKLKARIERKTFKSSSDTEVLLYFLIQNKENLKIINGIYSFVFIDLLNEKVTFSRDPLGVKPIYFAITNDGIIISSEPKSIVKIENKLKKISEESVVNLINYGYVGSENSLFKNINAVPIGTTYEYSKSNLKKIYTIDPNNMIDDNSYLDKFNQKDIENEITLAIKSQTISDVPISIWQSGGIDSTLINYVLKNENIQNFILKIHGNNFDESDVAKIVSNDLNRKITEISWPNSNDMAEKFKKMVWHVDGEIADSSAMASLILSEQTSKYSKVVFTGDGGDELFGGYATYNATLFAKYFKILPKSISLLLSAFSSKFIREGSRYSFFELMSRFFLYTHMGSKAHSQWRRYSNHELSKKLFTKDCLEINHQDLFYKKIDEYHKNLHFLKSTKSKAQAIDLKFYLPSDMLLKTDRMTMAYGLEARVPLLDFNLIKNLYLYDRDNFNSYLSETKPILRKMLKNLGVSKQIHNKKKTGFNINVDYCIDQLKNYQKKLFSDYDIFEGYFDINTVRKIISENDLNRSRHNFLVWSLMCFAQSRYIFNT